MRKVILFPLLLVASLVCVSTSTLSQFTENGNYIDWGYSPSSVYGLVKLTEVRNRDYYKLSRIDASATRVQTYDAAGKITNTTVLRFVNGKINSITRTNRWGDTYEIVKFKANGPNDFLVTRRSYGKNDMLPCKGARYIYRNNLLAEVRYVDYNNNPCNSSSGVAIIRYKRYEDKARYSLAQEVRYLDDSQMPVMSASFDCHQVVYEYNDRAQRTMEAYFGLDGEPITNRYGVYKIKNEYNQRDELVRKKLIGLNEEPVMNSYGVSVTEYEYRDGFEVKSVRLNDQMRIAKSGLAGDGVAMVSNEYDESGNMISTRYFDESGNPINSTSGYHKVTYTYNAQQMLVNEAFFDRNQEPAADHYKVHRYSYGRDSKGRMIQEAYYDKSNQPVKDGSDQVYIRRYKYDEAGRVVSSSYWRDETTPMPRWNGYYAYLNVYNEEGLVTEMTYLDDKGNLFKSTSGYSREVRRYTPDARIAERKWFDGTTPAYLTNTLASNFHSIRYNYDGKGRVASLGYFDASGNPATARISLGTDEGFECTRIEFYYQGNALVEERFFKVYSSSPFKVIDCLKEDYVTVSGITRGYPND